MKVYISADIEGITGTTHFDETDIKKPDYNEFREQMTAEVAAACKGATEAGATEIWMKDAHDTGRNILASKLPENTKLVRGWSGHPLSMAQELDESFDAMMMIGYHAKAGSPGSPLAHTMTGRFMHMKINDRYASEFLIHAYAAASCNVPVVLVTGDHALSREVQAINSNIETVSVKEGIGESTISIHPNRATQLIHAGAKSALNSDIGKCLIPLPDTFSIEMRFKKHSHAYRNSFYPGAKIIDDFTVVFETDVYFEFLRFLLFVTGI